MLKIITKILNNKFLSIKDKITINRKEDIEIISKEPFEVISNDEQKCCFFKYIFKDKGGFVKKKTLDDLKKENKIGFILKGEFNGSQNIKYRIIDNKILKDKLPYKKTEIKQIFEIECCIVIIKAKINKEFYIKNSIGESIKVPININGVVVIIFEDNKIKIIGNSVYTLLPIKKTKLFLHFDINDKIYKMYYTNNKDAINFLKDNI